MKEIRLTNSNLVALVDDEDYKRINEYTWFLIKTSTGLQYAQYTNTRSLYISMHRMVMDTEKGIRIDHKNEYGLDNRKQNLRVATVAQNAMNRGRNYNNKSGFKGVYWNKSRNIWRAEICINGKHVYLGDFGKKENAAIAYDRAALKYFKGFANLNFPLVDATFWSMNLNLF